MSWFEKLLGKDPGDEADEATARPVVARNVPPATGPSGPFTVTLPPPPVADDRPAQVQAGASIAVDLGTSASAVATATHAEGPPFYVHFDTLGELDARMDDRVPLIGSDLVGPLEAPGSGDIGYILGRTGRDWVEWLRAYPKNGLVTPSYYASVKRMLDISDRLETLRYSLGSVFRELLLLALCPARSGTLRARYLMDHGLHDWTTPVDLKSLEAYASIRQVGFPAGVRRYLAGAVRQAGLDLYVTVPNAYALGEIDLMVSAARKAGADAIRAWGVKRSGLPAVRVLREAEAVACWHHHCLRLGAGPDAPSRTLTHPPRDNGPIDRTPPASDEPERPAGAESRIASPENARPPTYWLVFDMGAGTTDLALVEVRDQGYHLLQRSGLPIGGDDVDLLFIRHLARGALRDYFADIGTGTQPVSFDEVAEHLRRTVNDPAPQDGQRAPLERPTWRRLGDTLFLQGLSQPHRLALKRLARECKVAWSHAMRAAGGDADPYLEAIFDLPAATPDLDDDPALEDLGRSLLLVPGYRFLVHLATRGCCQALLERTGPLPSPVSRVIISGRAARLPLIAEALSHALEETGYARTGVTAYEWPLAGRDANRPATEVDGKLAVVRGAAWYGFRRWDHALPRGVSNDIVLQTFLTNDGENALLFRQGEPLAAGGTARRLVAFHFQAERPDAHFRLRLYHQRLPAAFLQTLSRRRPDLLEALLGSTVCRRTLVDLFRRRVSHPLGIEIDEARRTLSLFAPSDEGTLQRLQPASPNMPASKHPITGLPEDWLWEGEGVRIARPLADRRHP